MSTGPDSNSTCLLKDSKIEKDLGVSIDSDLDFKTHVANVSAKAN